MNSFKIRLDKFWWLKEILWNYRVDNVTSVFQLCIVVCWWVWFLVSHHHLPKGKHCLVMKSNNSLLMCGLLRSYALYFLCAGAHNGRFFIRIFKKHIPKWGFKSLTEPLKIFMNTTAIWVSVITMPETKVHPFFMVNDAHLAFFCNSCIATL